MSELNCSSPLDDEIVKRFNEIHVPCEVFNNKGNCVNFLKNGYILYMRMTADDQADIALMNPKGTVPFSEVEDSP